MTAKPQLILHMSMIINDFLSEYQNDKNSKMPEIFIESMKWETIGIYEIKVAQSNILKIFSRFMKIIDDL